MTLRAKPLVVLLNGSFGIGKSTVAPLLRARIPRSVLVNPEPIGLLLQFPQRLLGAPGDFQDIPSWRTLSVLAVRLATSVYAVVIVPMAISRVDYLREIVLGLAKFAEVRHLCMTTDSSIVEGRILQRAERQRRPKPHWELRRAADCFAAHRDPEFSLIVDIGVLPPPQVVDLLLDRLAFGTVPYLSAS